MATRADKRPFEGLDTPNTAASFWHAFPFTDDVSVVNGKTSKKSMQKRRGGFWCVKALTGKRASLFARSSDYVTSHVNRPFAWQMRITICPELGLCDRSDEHTLFASIC